ncbi:MAG: hypothetical protein J4G14_13010 [Dehalococcoidia bacterium]|nr:hypothetical protein [Dehalococcoidia bacterium]
MNDESVVDSDCQHYWMIEQPNGPTSNGRCKVCGTVREFKNSIQGSGWDRDGRRRRAARQQQSSST